MRGRTLNHAFIILDEAQNTTPEQMKMFLTRIGFGTKAVVTGDVTQIDLPRGQKSGLIEARPRFSRTCAASRSRSFTSADVVRHPLVQKIINAYERDTAPRRNARASPTVDAGAARPGCRSTVQYAVCGGERCPPRRRCAVGHAPRSCATRR